MESNAALSEKLNTAWKFFYGRGFIDGFGHISARTAEPDQILISPHYLGRNSTPEDFALIDLDGNPVGQEAQMPSELPIHLEIYKSRPDVGSVAHFHCLYPTSFSMSSVELRPTYFLASIFRDGIPIHPDSRLVNDAARGVALARTLGGHRAALMKAHGIVVTGDDIVEMAASVFILEDNAHRTWISAAMGEVDYLSDEDMAKIEPELLKARGPYKRIWSLCEDEVRERERTGG